MNNKYAVTLETEVPMSKERLSRNQGVIKVDYGLVPSGYTWIFPKADHLPGDLHRGRALLIGDAAGLANAFTGEGIYSALFSAYLAAEVITEQITMPKPDLQLYTGLVQEKLMNDLANAFRITRWFYPASGLVHELLQHHQGLAADLIQAVAGDMVLNPKQKLNQGYYF